jgi:quercetin dioxygenase-like cupin family protein
MMEISEAQDNACGNRGTSMSSSDKPNGEMGATPKMAFHETAEQVEAGQVGAVEVMRYINEPGKVSFGVIDYVPGWFIATHHHRTWELIVIDGSSEGPGYTFFDGKWWRADPGSAVYLPKGVPHAWSAGSKKGFKMLWVYGGSTEEAGRIFDGNQEDFQSISVEEEQAAVPWRA